MTGIVRSDVPRHRHCHPQRHLIRRHKPPGHRRQASGSSQDGQITQRIHARGGCVECLSARQRIYPDAGVFRGGADVIQDVPGGHQHARRHLETGPHRGAAIQHPAQVPGHPCVRDARRVSHDDPADSSPDGSSDAGAVTARRAGRPLAWP